MKETKKRYNPKRRKHRVWEALKDNTPSDKYVTYGYVWGYRVKITWPKEL